MAVKLVFLLGEPKGIVSGCGPLLLFFSGYFSPLLEDIVPSSYFLPPGFGNSHCHHLLFGSIILLSFTESLSFTCMHSSMGRRLD